jgi:hypothetical protein
VLLELDEVPIQRGRDWADFHSRFANPGDVLRWQVVTVFFDSAVTNSRYVPATA